MSRRERRSVTGVERVGPYTLLRFDRVEPLDERPPIPGVAHEDETEQHGQRESGREGALASRMVDLQTFSLNWPSGMRCRCHQPSWVNSARNSSHDFRRIAMKKREHFTLPISMIGFGDTSSQ